MKKVELVPGIKSSVLGFGCAPILGSVGANKSKRAIECAIDCGVNHFDIARSYGYGEAEAFLGRHLFSKRHEMVIASKFGIKANIKAKILSPVKPLVRYLKDWLRPVKSTGSQQGVKQSAAAPIADKFHYRIAINEQEMRKSLEQSLKALRTDYLDYFFVHEPLVTIANFEELEAAATNLKKEGKIKAWGLAYMRSQEHLHSAYLNRFDILQYNLSPGANDYEDFAKLHKNKPSIIFSPLNGQIGDKSPAEKLGTLAGDFLHSVILCSMFNETHIKSNAALFK